MKRVPVDPETKKHYEILDGLRGVAAMMVVIFHMFEAYADNDRFKQIMNHGYLAVDFFFLLSGFVVAYAYDDRWEKMTHWDFYKRRLIRLQPMVVLGSMLGATLYYFQKSSIFPLISTTPVWRMLIVMLVGCTMIPLLPSMDIRGWGEMHPLNSPAWSLFYEYVANILYAAGFRKLSNKWLVGFVFLSACLLIDLTLFGSRGDVIGGWSIDETQLRIGFARMLYPFFAGILLMRSGWRIHVRSAFLVCSLILVAILSVPRIGGPQHLWLNGLYEAVCIIVVFPMIVLMGASETVTGTISSKICKLAGVVSYPLYITHYPLIYLYTAWVLRNKILFLPGAAMGAVLFVVSITLAYAYLKLYDEPVRQWLKHRLLVVGKSRAHKKELVTR